MAMLSHELKTPMSVIRMALGGAAIPATVRDPVARAIDDMQAVVERAVQADRLRHGRIACRPVRCRLAEEVEAVRAASRAPERIRIEAADVPSLLTDHELLRVILGNLIDNALKYSPVGSPVTVSVASRAHKGRAGVEIAVANPPGAAGMPDANRVFRKYYRSPGAHGKTGSGLGLHISSGMVRLIGGSISYHPLPDQARFSLWIPLSIS